MKIGIVGKGFSSSFGVNKMYLEFARRISFFITKEENHQITVIFPYSTQIDNTLDLLILPGGADVLDFSTTPTVFTGNSDRYYEHFDKVMLPKYVEAGIAIFGICRGFQTLNVAFGGTLHDEIFQHDYSKQDERHEKVHSITFQKDFERLIEAIPRQIIKVNSLHHQGIKTIGDSLVPLVKAEDKDWTIKSLTEAFIHEDLPIAGVQWHPEEIFCKTSMKIIKEIVRRSKEMEPGQLAIILEQHGL